MKHSKLFADVLLALGKVEIIEQILHWPDRPETTVYGCQEGNTVWVNPLANKSKRVVVGTLIHEAIHFVRKSYSEKKTEAMTDVLWGQLSKSDIDSIYKIYRAFVQKRRGKVDV
jgi:hypothetical protein